MCNCINYKIRFALCSLAKEFPSFQSKTNGHRDISKGKPVLSQWRVKHYHPAFLNLYKQKNGADQYLNRNPNYPITQGIQFKKKGKKKDTKICYQNPAHIAWSNIYYLSLKFTSALG